MNAEGNGKNIGVGRLQLGLIMGIVAIPVIVSYVMFYTGFGIPTDTVNRGALVAEPLQLSIVSLTDNDGANWTFTDQGLEFRLLQVIDGECSEICRELLYVSRQVHTRLGKNGEQLQRVLVQTGATSHGLQQLLDAEYTGLITVNGDSAQWQRILSALGGGQLDGERVYVVDRRGFLVMYYTPDHSGGDMLKDLNHLIKTVQ